MPSFITRALSPRGESFFTLRRTFKKAKTPSITQKPSLSHIPKTLPSSPTIITTAIDDEDDLLMADIPLSPSPPASSHGHGHDAAYSHLLPAPLVSIDQDEPLNAKNVAFSRLPSHRRAPRVSASPAVHSPAHLGNHARELDPESEAFYFAGPPPPIVKSVFMTSPSASPSTSPTRQGRTSAGNLAASLASLGSVFFDTGRLRKQPARYQQTADSTWRRMQRHEKALAAELQRILDMQAEAIAQGFTGGSRSASPSSSYHSSRGSDDSGSPSRGTMFYSAATSKSKMGKSLYQTNGRAADGTVLPVHQPAGSPKKLGLRAARKALARSLADLSDLKHHEHRHIKAEIKSRNRALSRAERLAARKQQITGELHALEADDSEELACELRDLNNEHKNVTDEIAELEARLVALRNRQRSLTDKMTHVSSKREAGLSGYRGALKEVDKEISQLIEMPPVEPLHREAWADIAGTVTDDDGIVITGTGGPEFLALVPERRTVDLAKGWWESEIKLLEAKSDRVKKERVALEDGGRMWADTSRLIGEYESTLSRQMKGLADNGSLSANGAVEQTADSRQADELINSLQTQMRGVITVLRTNLEIAKTNKWNLLICAVGAELAAFEEADELLKFGVPGAKSTTRDSRAREEAEGLLLRSLESLHQGSRRGEGSDVEHDEEEIRAFGSALESQDPEGSVEDNGAEYEDEEERAYMKKHRAGLASPVPGPQSFSRSEESLPSPAFKPYEPSVKNQGLEEDDNEVPDFFLGN